MRITVFSRLAPALTLAASFVLPFVPSIARGHESPGYSHDSGPGGGYSSPEWMSKLSDTKKISHLNIPGTHDTMAQHGGDIAHTQTMSLRTQLHSGIRAVDIRCRHIKNAFAIHHGPIYQQANFDDVLTAVLGFLAEHPRETVLMRVKEEYNAESNTRAFDATFAAYVAKHPGKFWTPTSQNPTLGEVRGKIVVLQNFSSSTTYGIHWNSLDIQDKYGLDTNWDLEKKWNHVWDQVKASNGGDRNKIYVNFLSGSGGSFPYFVASGHSSPGTGAPRLATVRTNVESSNCCKMFPRVDCFAKACSIAFEGTNVLLYEHLHKDSKHVGIVMADFPGHGLIESVIKQNR